VRAGQASVSFWVLHTGLSHAPAPPGKTTRRAPSRNTQPIPSMLKGLDIPQPDVRHSGTPETILVTELVTAHTSPNMATVRKQLLADR
jgi:hypothetical protein